jgi:hypothetical protein
MLVAVGKYWVSTEDVAALEPLDSGGCLLHLISGTVLETDWAPARVAGVLNGAAARAAQEREEWEGD